MYSTVIPSGCCSMIQPRNFVRLFLRLRALRSDPMTVIGKKKATMRVTNRKRKATMTVTRTRNGIALAAGFSCGCLTSLASVQHMRKGACNPERLLDSGG